jgi:hypothetical protein
VIAEILVYFGGRPEQGDGKVRSNLAGEIVKAVEKGRA